MASCEAVHDAHSKKASTPMRTNTNSSQTRRTYEPLIELKPFRNGHPDPETSLTFESCSQVPAAGKRIGGVLGAMRHTVTATRNLLRRFMRLVTPQSTVRSVRKVCEYCARTDVPTKDIYSHLKHLRRSTAPIWPVMATDRFGAMPDASFAALGFVLMMHGEEWQIHQWFRLGKDRNFDSMPLSLACLNGIIEAAVLAKLQVGEPPRLSSDDYVIDASALERTRRLSEVDISPLSDYFSTRGATAPHAREVTGDWHDHASFRS